MKYSHQVLPKMFTQAEYDRDACSSAYIAEHFGEKEWDELLLNERIMDYWIFGIGTNPVRE